MVGFCFNESDWKVSSPAQRIIGTLLLLTFDHVAGDQNVTVGEARCMVAWWMEEACYPSLPE
jgi:hypothetical protein